MKRQSEISRPARLASPPPLRWQSPTRPSGERQRTKSRSVFGFPLLVRLASPSAPGAEGLTITMVRGEVTDEE